MSDSTDLPPSPGDYVLLASPPLFYRSGINLDAVALQNIRPGMIVPCDPGDLHPLQDDYLPPSPTVAAPPPSDPGAPERVETAPVSSDSPFSPESGT